MSFNIASTNNKTSFINPNTWNVYKKITLDFVEQSTNRTLEMKSCDYKYNKLLVGNGRAIKYDETSYTEQGANLYVFYNAPSWVERTDTITFENCGDYDVIDISSLGYKVYGFWGQFDDCVFVSCNLFDDVYLIQLGKGSTNFGEGNFASVDTNRYNGSFKILGHWHQNGGIGENSAHGGQFYKGNLYIAENDYDNATIYKCILKKDGTLKFDALRFDNVMTSDGNYRAYSYIDGVCIKDGKLYAQPLRIGNDTSYYDVIVADI